ncbi:hypothetical protein TanjilG_31302 [Lupinus angustifolius]|uniref:Uncharacterized protein n=1 Tax=Lupinus angustifolius TaxID=3871 RepID=A0A4P1RT81_LUPAN|nr:PREDICTED: uncharacterized protein LOC109359034 [Lupinus angustifolius]OIW18182.1 hypothetical protein TanjilG_31302 [Lupinus angustifolius]
MGGCATKPKVLKDDSDVKVKAPEPEPEPEPQPPKVEAVVETQVAEESSQPQHVKSVDEIKVPNEPQREVNTVVDDDQTNKQRSLNLLFNKENEDAKVSTENEKTGVKETVKEETLEAPKPLEDIKSNEPIVKQESSKPEENKVVNTEPAKQESPLIASEEKSSVQNNSNNPAEELVKSESKVEKLLEEKQIKDPLKQEFVDAKDTPIVETKNKEPIKENPLLESSNIVQLEAGKPSDGSKDEKAKTLIEETTTKVVPQPEEKVIEALLTDAGSVPKIITEEATFSSKEKNHNVVEHPPKAGDADKIKTLKP